MKVKMFGPCDLYFLEAEINKYLKRMNDKYYLVDIRYSSVLEKNIEDSYTNNVSKYENKIWHSAILILSNKKKDFL